MERMGQWHSWPEGQELLRTPQEDYMLLNLYACPTPGLWRVASTPVLHPEGFLHSWPLRSLTETDTLVMAGGLITVAMSPSSQKAARTNMS